MSKSQKVLTVFLLLALTATLVCFPWISRYHSEFSPIFVSPGSGYRPDVSRAWMIWFWIGAVYTGLFFIFKKSK
jgi:hypothetical protein